MDFKWQSLILIILILFSVTLTQFNSAETSEAVTTDTDTQAEKSTSTTDLLAFQGGAVADISPVKKSPVRKWDVLDPDVSAETVLVRSLNDSFPLYHSNIHEGQVLASLTKLLTAVIVFEEIGLHKTIPISAEAVETQGMAGNLKSGEVYSARDLLKVMLLTSSNDAAAAFEEYLGGTEAFVEIANRKMNQIGMTETVVHDGSGLNDGNRGTASDMLVLSKYILDNHPRIFTWTRSFEILVEPVRNDQYVESRTERNINSLVDERNYLGGKTGTSQAAGENIIALFNVDNKKLLIILMDSTQRDADTKKLIEWTKKAYTF